MSASSDAFKLAISGQRDYRRLLLVLEDDDELVRSVTRAVRWGLHIGRAELVLSKPPEAPSIDSDIWAPLTSPTHPEHGCSGGEEAVKRNLARVALRLAPDAECSLYMPPLCPYCTALKAEHVHTVYPTRRSADKRLTLLLDAPPPLTTYPIDDRSVQSKINGRALSYLFGGRPLDLILAELNEPDLGRIRALRSRRSHWAKALLVLKGDHPPTEWDLEDEVFVRIYAVAKSLSEKERTLHHDGLWLALAASETSYWWPNTRQELEIVRHPFAPGIKLSENGHLSEHWVGHFLVAHDDWVKELGPFIGTENGLTVVRDGELDEFAADMECVDYFCKVARYRIAADDLTREGEKVNRESLAKKLGIEAKNPANALNKRLSRLNLRTWDFKPQKSR